MGHVRLIGLLPKNFSCCLSRPLRGSVLTAEQVDTLVEDAAAGHILKIDTIRLHSSKMHDHQQQAQQQAQEGNDAQAGIQCCKSLTQTSSEEQAPADITEHTCC